MDYFGARYYASMQARFTAVDPVTLTKYHITNPQRWNGYVYALNNPLVMVDVDGKFPWTFHFRSFIYTTTVAFGSYAGDGRGPSTADSPTATSRIR
jgi:RHS repeat-associated protein